ncbi:MAG TPA: hypothetical protein V6C65_40025 [Allocoleopsis sp.]
MLTQTSLEVRWFLPVAFPDEVRQWFDCEQPTLTEAEQREDWYLLLADHRDVGIKLRQGKLEIKHRIGDRGVKKIVKGVKGRIEQWQKWSFSLAAEENALAHLPAEAGFWLAVQKSRWLKTYQVQQGAIAGVTPEAKPEQGCQIEMAEIVVQGQVWHSLGFEAFGQANTLEPTLMQGLELVFNEMNGVSLKAKQSLSYPQWLLRLSR